MSASASPRRPSGNHREHARFERAGRGVVELREPGRIGEGADRVHPDAVAAPLHRRGACEHPHRFLGHRVAAHRRLREDRRPRSHVHDATRRVAEVGEARLHEAQRGHRPRLPHRLHVAVGHLADRAVHLGLGVVHEQVDAPPPRRPCARRSRRSRRGAPRRTARRSLHHRAPRSRRRPPRTSPASGRAPRPCAPSAATASATPRPIPCPAPVTIAT